MDERSLAELLEEIEEKATNINEAIAALKDLIGDLEELWLTQDRMAELFGVKRPAITKHLKNIFESGELVENSVCSILERTATDGKNYSVKYYNLDAILSVGYRVNSRQATMLHYCRLCWRQAFGVVKS